MFFYGGYSLRIMSLIIIQGHKLYVYICFSINNHHILMGSAGVHRSQALGGLCDKSLYSVASIILRRLLDFLFKFVVPCGSVYVMYRQ
jgi:hypothetical protein